MENFGVGAQKMMSAIRDTVKSSWVNSKKHGLNLIGTGMANRAGEMSVEILHELVTNKKKEGLVIVKFPAIQIVDAPPIEISSMPTVTVDAPPIEISSMPTVTVDAPPIVISSMPTVKVEAVKSLPEVQIASFPTVEVVIKELPILPLSIACAVGTFSGGLGVLFVAKGLGFGKGKGQGGGNEGV